MQLYLEPEIKHSLGAQKNLFEQVMSLRGEVFRELENRKTQRVILNNQPYFIKQHFGIGWKEIFKNLFQLRLPAFGAKNEWQAIQQLRHCISVPEVMGYGKSGYNPARQRSFLITRELPNFITLEDLGKQWQTQKPVFALKHALILEVARIAREMHQLGINHRDFYLCHFLLDLIEYPKQHIKLYLIDLHRAQLRKHTPMRWVIKDLAGLYFSSKDMGLTQRDIWRFIKSYSGLSLRDSLNRENLFWLKVKKRGDKLYRDHRK